MNLLQLNFPALEIKVKEENSKTFVFDKIRKRWLQALPEEWVRQNLITYLTDKLNYPKTLIAIEKKIVVAKRTLRFDALVYNRDFSPLIIVECKAPEVKITQDTFDQIVTYNYSINAPYLLVTNGLFHVFCKIDKDKTFKFIEEILDYESL